MRIAINARMLKSFPDDGISRFTFEVVKRITLNNPSHHFILIFDRNFGNELLFSENTEAYIIKPAARHPLQWYFWHEWQLPRILKKCKAGLFLSPDGFMPLRLKIPSVPVIHDIAFFHRRGDVPLITSLYYRYFFRKFAEKAARIVTVSDFCKNDISSYLNIDPCLIDVAHNGVSGYFSPVDKSSSDIFRTGLTGGVPYFLFVGNFSPRKNIPGVINAYNLFRKTSALNHKLVLTGGRLFLNSETDRLLASSPWSEDIIITGPVKHEDLRMLYGSAAALVFVPWFEGFGIPAAEAMRCGTPVILSDTTSLPEIGGDAALFADPSVTEEICNAMKRIASEEELRERLSEAGLKQSDRFTWDKTAQSVWGSIEKAAADIK